jgi:hypothetical protein
MQTVVDLAVSEIEVILTSEVVNLTEPSLVAVMSEDKIYFRMCAGIRHCLITIISVGVIKS